jgi:hypothetical protein
MGVAGASPPFGVFGPGSDGMELPLGDYDDPSRTHALVEAVLGLYPIVTFEYSSTALYQVSYHIQHLFF